MQQRLDLNINTVGVWWPFVLFSHKRKWLIQNSLIISYFSGTSNTHIKGIRLKANFSSLIFERQITSMVMVYIRDSEKAKISSQKINFCRFRDELRPQKTHLARLIMSAGHMFETPGLDIILKHLKKGLRLQCKPASTSVIPNWGAAAH
jgi:hypothetical protein